MTEEEIKALQDELEGLKAEKEALTDELLSRNARLSELGETLAAKDSELATLKQALAESDDSLNRLSDSLSQTIAGYKTLVVQSNPDVLVELITGDSIEAINSSLTSAKELISEVRKGIEAEISSARVPAGAPERSAPDLSALSPIEKIQYGGCLEIGS